MVGFDPISIVGFVGTSAGLISFIANTVENLHKRTQLYEECFNELYTYLSDFNSLLRKLKRWRNVWRKSNGTAYQVADYEYLWGHEGFVEIQNLMRIIKSDTIAIESIFRFRHPEREEFRWQNLPRISRRKPDHLDVEDWNQILNHNTSENESTPLDLEPSSPTAKLFLKFSFAIYKNEQIKTKIAGLKTRIEMLKSRSKEYLWKARGDIDFTEAVDPDPATVARLLSLKTNYENFLNTFSDIRQLHDAKHYCWELVLGTLDLSKHNEEPETFFVRDDSLYERDLEKVLDVLVENRSLSSNFYIWNKHTFSVKYPETWSRAGCSLREMTEKWNEGSVAVAERGRPSQSCLARWRKAQNVLERAANSSPTDEDIQNGYQEVSRLLSTAADVARITILFHGSKWAAKICACRVIHLSFGSERDSKKILTLSILPPRRANEECSHHPQGVSHTPFLLLAVLLLEIGITGPVKIHSTAVPRAPTSELSFTLPEEVIPSGLSNPLTISELRAHISEILGSAAKYHVGSKYAQVIESCFEMRDALLHSQGTNLRAQQLEYIVGKIAKPLEQHRRFLRECL